MLKSNLVFFYQHGVGGGAAVNGLFTDCFPLIVMYMVHYLLHLNKPVCCWRARAYIDLYK